MYLYYLYFYFFDPRILQPMRAVRMHAYVKKKYYEVTASVKVGIMAWAFILFYFNNLVFKGVSI